jgi:hypothetical protein
MKEQRIYKYELSKSDCQNISMPIGAEILTCQAQNQIPCIWALVDPKAETEIRTFEIYGTGHPVLSDMGTSRKYISTFQLQGGLLVFHVFEYTGI